MYKATVHLHTAQNLLKVTAILCCVKHYNFGTCNFPPTEETEIGMPAKSRALLLKLEEVGVDL